MYKRGSNSWHDLSYGSVYSASNGSPNGSGSYSGPEAQNGSAPHGYAPSAPAYAPADPSTTYERTSYEAAYAPAHTQPFPAVPAAAPGTASMAASMAAPAMPVTDVTTYDPATGLPQSEFVYPMRNVAGRMAMVCGVVAILFTSILFPLFPLAFFFALGAIVLGRRGRLRARYGFASNPGSAGGGFALGVISMALVVVWSGLAAWLFLTYSATDLKDCVQDTHNAAEGIRCVADVVDAG